MNSTTRDKLNRLGGGEQDAALGDQVMIAQGDFGKRWYLDPVNGDDGNSGSTPDKAFLTLPVAYAALTADKNEVLCIIGGATSLKLSTAFTWAKSYTHMVGIGGQLRFGGRVRIGQATATPLATMITISGNGCIFKNIHFQHGQASATNLICVDVSGLRNMFDNCHFEATLDSVAGGASYAWRAVQLESGAQANNFYRCTFGSWTDTVVWASTAGKLLYFMGDNADTYVENCLFVMNHSSTGFVPVDFAGVISGGYSYVMFDDCKFIATNAKPAVIFGIPTNGWIFLNKSNAFNVTAWSTTNAKLIEANGAANATSTGIGVAQA